MTEARLYALEVQVAKLTLAGHRHQDGHVLPIDGNLTLGRRGKSEAIPGYVHATVHEREVADLTALLQNALTALQKPQAAPCVKLPPRWSSAAPGMRMNPAGTWIDATVLISRLRDAGIGIA